MLQDQPCHQARSAPPVSPSAARTTPACRRSSSAVLLRTGRSAAARGVALPSASSGMRMDLSPILVVERDSMRSKAGHSMMQNDRSEACRKSDASVVSAARSAWASAATRTLAQADRSNIQAGISSQRSASEPLRLQRKTMPSALLDRLVNADPKTKPRMPSDTAVLETRFRGCSQALLYNTVRPHSALNYRPPAPQAFVPAAHHLDEIILMQ